MLYPLSYEGEMSAPTINESRVSISVQPTPRARRSLGWVTLAFSPPLRTPAMDFFDPLVLTLHTRAVLSVSL